MSLDQWNFGRQLKQLYPDPPAFFGVDRQYPLQETLARIRWQRRGRLRRIWDWLRRTAPPPGPRLIGWRVSGVSNEENLKELARLIGKAKAQ